MKSWKEICEIKDKLQDEGIEAWKNNKGRATLVRYTGSGKSTEAIKIITKCKEKNPDLDVYISAPTTILVNKWIEDTKHFTNIRVGTHIEASKNVINTGLFIIDEVDAALAATLAKMLTNIKYKFILGLTATLKRKDKRETILEKYAPKVHEITLKQGIALGIFSNHIVFNLNITLNESEQEKYNSIEKALDTYFCYFQRDFNILRSCNTIKGCESYIKEVGLSILKAEGDNFVGLDERNAIRQLQKYAGLAGKYIRDREELVQKNETIKFITAKLVSEMNVKTICFGEHNETADEIAERINIFEGKQKAISYHSKKSDKENALTYKEFQQGFLKYIISSRKLISGINEEDLILGVDVSYTSSERDYQQKKGRVLRIDRNNLNKLAVFVNIVIKNTVSERWNKAKTYGDNSIINVNSLENLYEIYNQKLNKIKC